MITDKLMIQECGQVFIIINDEKRATEIFNNETTELYRVDSETEGLIEDEEDLLQLMKTDSVIGIDIGNLLDLDTEVLEDTLYAKKYGYTPRKLGELLNTERPLYECENRDFLIATQHGYSWSEKYHLWLSPPKSNNPIEMDVFLRLI